MSNVWVIQEVWSDGKEDNLSHYSDQTEAEQAFKETVENLTKEWGDCEDFEIFSNEDTAILQFSEHEVTVYLKEMPLNKAEIPRFFAEKKIANKAKLTDEEIKFFENLESEYFKKHIGDKTAGAYVRIEIYDIEDFEEEGEVLHFTVWGGIEGDGEYDLSLESYARKDKCVME